MIPRIAPSRCTGDFDDALLTDDKYVAEPKLDGARYMLYLNDDGTTVNLYSRRDFPRIDKAANVPHFAKPYKGLEGTILDGEVMLPSQTQLGDTTGIMNSAPAKAIAEQAKKGLLEYNVFDVLYYNGQDMRKKPLSERRKLLVAIVKAMHEPTVKVVPQYDDKAGLFKREVDAGREGVVLKNVGSSYGMNWVKCKRRSDFTVIVTGFQPGKGKYSKTLGALLFSVYQNGTLVEVGKCSGMTDDERDAIWANQAAWKGQPIDVFAQEVTKDGRLRHPVWHRKRDDVAPETCTWDKLKEDAKKAKLKGGDKK